MVREFTDDNGRVWRAWEVRPEEIHPQTKAEDYLSDVYEMGWIVFETSSGDEKRRLSPPPREWINGSDEDLRNLLVRAVRVPDQKLAAERQTALDATAAAPSPQPDGAIDVTDLPVVRSFRYPGGRIWTVCEAINAYGKRVLRFTAGSRYLDLENWPRDWEDAPEPRLVQMLRGAAPRPVADLPSLPAHHRRRWTDPPLRQ